MSTDTGTGTCAATDLLVAIGLEALYVSQKRMVFERAGHFLTRNEFMANGFMCVLNPIAVVLCARAGMNLVQLDGVAPPAPAPAMQPRRNGIMLAKR